MDYKKLREDRAREREELKEIENSMKLNLGTGAKGLDQMLEILTKGGKSPVKVASKPVALQKTANVDDTKDDLFLSKYAEVVKELDRFPFSQNTENYKKQMSFIISSVRSALAELIVKEVGKNTKEAYGDHMSGLFKINGGVKVEFKFDDKKFAVAARGAFMGEETICVFSDNNKIKARVVVVKEDGDIDDISSNYSITMEG